MSPTPRLVFLLGCGFAIGLLLVVGRVAIPGERWILLAQQGWWVALAVSSCVLAIDAVRRRSASSVEVRRSLPGSVPLGVETSVRLRIRQGSPHALRLSVIDHTPNTFQVRDLPVDLVLPADEEIEIRYRVVPLERGDARFDPCAIRVRSRWRLWEFHLRSGAAETIRVYPNFAAIARLEGLDLEQQAHQIGVHLQARREEGTDFVQLREFREGDTLRQIDWKATARHRKPIARQYSDERDQPIVFALDCGRRMRTKDGPISHFDHALNALLICAYMALHQGDSVGVLSFSTSVRWLPPRKGRTSMNTLLRQLYDLRSDTAASDFLGMAEHLLSRHDKRSLIVLISNLREEETDDLLKATHLLSKRHRVLVASLREQVLDDVLARPIEDFEAALIYAGTTYHVEGRERMLRRLRNSGIHVVESEPQLLHVALAREYLMLKRNGLI